LSDNSLRDEYCVTRSFACGDLICVAGSELT
jgi:hypothetical protein